MSYYEEQKQKNTLHLRELIDELPAFVDDFFRGISQTTSVKTRIAYAYDLKIFFNYLFKNVRKFENKEMFTLLATDLAEVSTIDIEKFMEYVSYYEKEVPVPRIYTNDENGKLRKLSAVRRLYKFLHKREIIEKNPAAIADAPKIHEKSIVRLEVNEMCDFLDEVENGENLTTRQKQYHTYTQKRDLAMVTLLLGTGMRVSECVGIDVNDIDFNVNGVKVTRKGGNETILYFGEEVEETLKDYLEERAKKDKKEENALFISLQGKRINVRTVQKLVKKYSEVSVKLKKISPHKLRS
ncbi:MAG: tyrosine-type recombinase/integrase, partial [Anaerotignaceae bacterium]